MEREIVWKSLPYLLLLVLISLLLIFFENFGWTESTHAMVEKGTKPIKATIYRGGQRVSGVFSFLTFWRLGYQRIKHLEERNRELLVEAQKAQTLEEENRALRAQLEAPLQTKWKLEITQTLGRSRYLTIDKGEKEGVKAGQIAIFKNILVGKVVKVGPHESQIELPTDPESKIPARAAKTGAQGLLVGQFRKGMNLEKVTQDENLEVEDTVVTTGEGGYPKGLLVGKIDWVERKESELFQKAGVKPLLNFAELELVFLIKN